MSTEKTDIAGKEQAVFLRKRLLPFAFWGRGRVADGQVAGNRKTNKPATGRFDDSSSVDFFPVSNGEHNNDMDRIVNRVNDTIVSRAQAVFVGITQFFCLVRSWVDLQFKQTVFQERLNKAGQGKEFFSALRAMEIL